MANGQGGKRIGAGRSNANLKNIGVEHDVVAIRSKFEEILSKRV